MSDSFFGFDTSEPGLGPGKLGDGNELMKALEDEEIDNLNDETFGAAVEEDWEEQHEKLAAVIDGYNGVNDLNKHEINPFEEKENELEQSIRDLVVDDEELEDPAITSMSFGRPIPGRTHPVNLDSLYGPASPPGLLHAEQIVRGQQNIWGSPARESSVPKQEEGIKNLLHALKAPRPHQQYTDPSIVVAGKLTANLPNARTLDEIEMQLGAPQGPPPQAPPPQGGAPRAMTVEELERQMRGDMPQGRRTSPPMPQPGMPLPVGTPPHGPPFMQQPHPQGMPPPGHPMPRGVFAMGRSPGPKGPVTILQRQPQSQSPVLGQANPSPPVIQQRPPGLRSPSPTQLANLLSSSPLAPQALAALQSLPPEMREKFLATILPQKAPNMKFQGNGGMSGSPIGVPPPPMGNVPPPGHGNRSSPTPISQFLSNTPVQQQQQQRINHPPNNGHNIRPRASQSFPQGHNMRQTIFEKDHYNSSRNNRQQYGGPNQNQFRPQQWKGRDGGYNRDNLGGYHEGYRERHDRGDGYQRGRGRGHYNSHNSYHHHRHEYNDSPVNSPGEDGDKDVYAGLMTQKEKDWVIKIQMFQLQTDNPYLDDYYYTTWTMNKAARERIEREGSEKDSDAPTLVLPQLSRLETKAYKPVQFEGSLGRLTASSVHNPRQILDIQVGNPQDALDAKGKEIRRFRQLLIDIEKNYDLLLDVMDIEKKALALPEDARPQMFEKRKTTVQELYEALHCDPNQDERFGLIITVRKGIKLAARLIAFLPAAAGRNVVAALLRHVPGITKKDWQDEVLPSVYNAMAQVISQADLETLVMFCEELRTGVRTRENQTNSIVTALQNKFGSSVIWCLVTRGETLYTNVSPVDMDVTHQQAWNQFVMTVAASVATVSKDALAKPYIKYARAQQHLTRLVDKRTLVTVEDKLQTLLVPSQS